MIKGFPQILAMLCAARGISQRDLAKKVSVSPSTVCRWFKGQGLPDYNEIKKLRQMLDCSYEVLLSDELKLTEEKKPILFRPHRGSLEDSLKEARSFYTKEEVRRYIVRYCSELEPCFTDSRIKCEFYAQDKRISWDTYIITGSGVIGFTNQDISCPAS